MIKRKSNNKISRKKEKKQDKQLRYILIVIGIILAIIIGAYFYIESLKNFEFLGLKFQKIDESGLKLYYTQLQITQDNGQTALYPLYLRNDPRKLNLAPIEYIRADVPAYISISPSASTGNACNEGMVAFLELGKFLSGMGFNVKTALADKNQSEEFNRSYITCDDAGNKTVLLFEGGNKTEIVKQGECYRIKIADCEVIKATETVIVSSIATSRGYI